jgi:hypothetical protein
MSWSSNLYSGCMQSFSLNHPITAGLGISLPISLVKLLSHTTFNLKGKSKLNLVAESRIIYIYVFLLIFETLILH